MTERRGALRMILYRTPGCPRCTEVAEALEELAIAHEVVEVDSPDDVPEDLEAVRLPVLRDGHEVFQGPGDVLDHLEGLESFRADWYKFQSDACYCDEEGNVE